MQDEGFNAWPDRELRVEFLAGILEWAVIIIAGLVIAGIFAMDPKIAALIWS